MDSDRILQKVVKSADFGHLLKALEDEEKIDAGTDSFKQVFELCIRNGETVAFGRMLKCLPELRLRAGSKSEAAEGGQARKDETRRLL